MFDLEIYWDDSGTHDGSPIAIAACYVATKEQWGEFTRNWDEVRREEGFDVFHMTDFMALAGYRKKPFCDWPQAKKTRVYRRLASIINTRVRHGFVFGVPVSAFERYAPERFKRESTPDPFTFAVQNVLTMISDWYARFGYGKAIQYVFEDRPGTAKIRQLWELMKEDPRQAHDVGARPGSPDGMIFGNKQEFKPLQAADILAWNSYAYLGEQINTSLAVSAPRPKPYLSALWTDRPMRIALLSEEQMKEAFQIMQDFEQREGKRCYTLPRRILKQFEIGDSLN